MTIHSLILLEKEKVTIEKLFENNEVPSDAINEMSLKLQEISKRIETKEERWLELSMKLE